MKKYLDLYNFEYRWKLRDWVDREVMKTYEFIENPNSSCYYKSLFDENIFFYIFAICKNPSAMFIVENFKDTIHECKFKLEKLSENPYAIHYLKKYPQNINWENLSLNTSEGAIELLEFNEKGIEFDENGNQIQGTCKINWAYLSENPSAIRIIERNMHKVHWYYLSKNPSAIHILEKNMDKINWDGLSLNPAAIHILKKNFTKIHWSFLSSNPAAIDILEENPDKINWFFLSKNTAAIHLLEKNINKINWEYLSSNPEAIHILKEHHDKIDYNSFGSNPNIFELDYKFFEKRMDIIKQELMELTWHPKRIRNWCLSNEELM